MNSCILEKSEKFVKAFSEVKIKIALILKFRYLEVNFIINLKKMNLITDRYYKKSNSIYVINDELSNLNLLYTYFDYMYTHIVEKDMESLFMII